jgi:VIT1/CCC1 family predicted Fe2+/Mn2+ transporter
LSQGRIAATLSEATRYIAKVKYAEAAPLVVGQLMVKLLSTSDHSDDSSALALSLEVEKERLAAAASSDNIVEGLMRLRALSEIESSLSTAELLEEAVRVHAQSGFRKDH